MTGGHRVVGRDHHLFVLSSEIGRGLVTWPSHGARLRHILEGFWREAHHRAGYDIVMTPHLGRSELWGTSRQLDFHQQGMFPELTVEGTRYLVKGANCPLHMQLFAEQPRRERDLPVRFAEISTLYRLTPAGSLKGLKYARTVSQDDAHIFCSGDHVVDEIVRYIDFARRLLAAFGFTDLRPYLGTRDARSVDGDAQWQHATSLLRTGLAAAGLDPSEVPGGATYYAPRAGIEVVDRHGTPWALPDLQVDLHLPVMCGLHTTDGAPPAVLHRTVLGSIERFVAALVEHYGPVELPAWLKPVHLRVLPVREDHEEAARALVEQLRSMGVAVEADLRHETVRRRMARSHADGVPLVVGVGDDEVRTGRYRVRHDEPAGEAVTAAELGAQALALAVGPDPSL